MSLLIPTNSRKRLEEICENRGISLEALMEEYMVLFNDPELARIDVVDNVDAVKHGIVLRYLWNKYGPKEVLVPLFVGDKIRGWKEKIQW
jgi:hypothetical protein